MMMKRVRGEGNYVGKNKRESENVAKRSRSGGKNGEGGEGKRHPNCIKAAAEDGRQMSGRS
jgi:hypothetical protein